MNLKQALLRRLFSDAVALRNLFADDISGSLRYTFDHVSISSECSLSVRAQSVLADCRALGRNMGKLQEATIEQGAQGLQIEAHMQVNYQKSLEMCAKLVTKGRRSARRRRQHLE